MAYHETHELVLPEMDQELEELRQRRRERRYTASLVAAAASFLIAFLVTAIVLYSARNLTNRLADYQLDSCMRGNVTRGELRAGQQVLEDLVTTVLPGLRGALRVQFLEARRQLERGIRELGAVDCQAIVPR